MYGWILAGLALGILLSSLFRRVPDGSLAEMTYITFVSVFDEWRGKRKSSGQTIAAEPSAEQKRLSAAASRLNLL